MESLNGNLKNSVDRLAQLESENQFLLAQNQQLRSENASVLAKLEKQTEAAERYEESQSRFESIFYQSKLGNKIISSDLKILQVNEALQNLLGYSEEEIVGTRIIQYAHPDFAHDWNVLQENLWTKQIPAFQLETCLIRKDGTSIWCQITSIIFKDQGTTLGYTILEDINTRKLLEQRLKKLYDKQETIMHMVAHDLKNPLFNIKVLAGFLKENLERFPADFRESNQESFDFLQKILETCDKTFDLIKDLLIVGELETAKVFEETHLQPFIQHLLTTLGVGAQKKGIKIHLQAPKKPLYANINREGFSRLLDNLLSNAVKFTPAGGKGEISISLKSTGKGILLQVRDTGIGIPESLIPSIFDKFTKANRVGTEGETTTGLGLYIVKQIVESYKGKIWVESKENEGTSFFIQLGKS